MPPVVAVIAAVLDPALKPLRIVNKSVPALHRRFQYHNITESSAFPFFSRSLTTPTPTMSTKGKERAVEVSDSESDSDDEFFTAKARTGLARGEFICDLPSRGSKGAFVCTLLTPTSSSPRRLTDRGR